MLIIPCVAIVAGTGVALAERQAPPVQAVAAGAGDGVAIAAPTTTPTTAAPIVVSIPTTAAVAVTAPPKAAPVSAVKPPIVAAPVTIQAPVVTAPRLGKVESCGWAWDAQRIDDGSYDGVVISLDAPYRPNTPVTITAAPHGPITVPTVRAVMTDGNGQASIEVRLSEDKRDWTLTISAAFPLSHCTPQAFTIAY